MATLPAGTVTFLFTDVEGSTTLWEEHPDSAHADLVRHDAIVEREVERHSGVLVRPRGEGDSRFAVFVEALDAVLAAAAIQRALHDEPWLTPGPLRVRIALHTGEADLRAGDYYGSAVNRCARLRSAASGGQTLLSQATAERVRGFLPADTVLRDLGQHRLKDLIHPEHIFQLTVPDLPAEFPLLKTLDSRANNLPAQQSAFIGREREVAAVCTLLQRPDVRVVTLTGPGGTGKTRLALQVAADLLDDFTQGVYFVALAPVSDPALVVATIATTLGLREAGDQPLQEILLDYLRDKDLLLVLDNFEQVVAAAPVVGTLLTAASRLKVLVTSRTVLHLYGEQEFAVPPLTLPTLHDLPASAMLVQYEAVALFIQRAQLAKADFAVTNENAAAVAEICVRLDGLPLAIELAAARVKMLAPQALLTRLEHRLQVLTGGPRDRPARQQTLRAAIAWSFTLLSPAEQALFARLGVFVGGWTVQAAEAICGATTAAERSFAGEDVLDGLEALVDKSMIRLEEQPALPVGASEPRFVMLETLREYAVECLAERAEDAALRRAHAAYYLALAEEAEPQLRGAEQEAWLKTLEAEHDNLRAALLWAQETGASEVGLRLAGALWRFWEMHGHPGEGRHWLETALARGGAFAPAVRAKALNGAGNLAERQGDYARARELHQQSLALRREAGDRRGIASSLGNLGNITRSLGDYAGARALLEESLALWRELQDTWGIASTLANLGNVEEWVGDYARAGSLYEEGLGLARELGDTWAIAMALDDLGVVAERLGDYARAAARYEEGLALARALGDTQVIAMVLNDLGSVTERRGDYARATALCEESLALARHVGDKSEVVSALANLGRIARHGGDQARAAALYLESLTTAHAIGNKRAFVTALGGLAIAVAARGQSLQAARLFGAAEVLREAIGSPLPPGERADYEEMLRGVRAALGEAGWEAARTRRDDVTLDEAMVITREASLA